MPTIKPYLNQDSLDAIKTWSKNNFLNVIEVAPNSMTIAELYNKIGDTPVCIKASNWHAVICHFVSASNNEYRCVVQEFASIGYKDITVAGSADVWQQLLISFHDKLALKSESLQIQEYTLSNTILDIAEYLSSNTKGICVIKVDVTGTICYYDAQIKLNSSTGKYDFKMTNLFNGDVYSYVGASSNLILLKILKSDVSTYLTANATKPYVEQYVSDNTLNIITPTSDTIAGIYEEIENKPAIIFIRGTYYYIELKTIGGSNYLASACILGSDTRYYGVVSGSLYFRNFTTSTYENDFVLNSDLDGFATENYVDTKISNIGDLLDLPVLEVTNNGPITPNMIETKFKKDGDSSTKHYYFIFLSKSSAQQNISICEYFVVSSDAKSYKLNSYQFSLEGVLQNHQEVTNRTDYFMSAVTKALYLPEFTGTSKTDANTLATKGDIIPKIQEQLNSEYGFENEFTDYDNTLHIDACYARYGNDHTHIYCSPEEDIVELKSSSLELYSQTSHNKILIRDNEDSIEITAKEEINLSTDYGHISSNDEGINIINESPVCINSERDSGAVYIGNSTNNVNINGSNVNINGNNFLADISHAHIYATDQGGYESGIDINEQSVELTGYVVNIYNQEPQECFIHLYDSNNIAIQGTDVSITGSNINIGDEDFANFITIDNEDCEINIVCEELFNITNNYGYFNLDDTGLTLSASTITMDGTVSFDNIGVDGTAIFNDTVTFNEIVTFNEHLSDGTNAVTIADIATKSTTYTKTQTDNLLSAKQDTLVSGTSIKTINGSSVLGSGDLTIAGTMVVDSQLDLTSTNPVQNKVITQALNDKCNPDGDYSGSGLRATSAEVADNLTPYSEESGDTQDDAFILEGTGTGNGSESVDTGSYAIIKEKRGNVLCVNQLVRSEDLSNDEYNGITRSRNNTNQTITYNGTVSSYTNNSYFSASGEMQLVVGHKYFWNIRLISGSVDISERTTTNITGGYKILPRTKYTDYSTGWDNFIFTQGSTVQAITLAWGADAGVKFNSAVFKLILVDLTQLYNNSIPSGLTADTFFRYYQGSLAYNLGELVASNGRYLKSVGRNQWDEEWEEGNLYFSSGLVQDSSICIRSKNYCRCIPNRKYHIQCANKSGLYWVGIYWYDRDKKYISAEFASGSQATSPSNALYFKIATNDATNFTYGNTYNHDITISLAYYKDQAETTLEDGYNQYYPYEELENIDTGSETLLSAGSAYDSKLPSGEIIRRVASKDLSTITNWYYDSNNGLWSTNQLSGTFTADDAEAFNVISDKYTSIRFNGIASSSDNNLIAFRNNGYIYVKNGSSTIEPSGTIIYPKSTPTTKQGTSFKSTIAIDDFGSLLADNTSFNGVPMGNSIFYPVDYKAFVDSVYNRASGSASDLVTQSELSAEDSKVDNLYAIIQENIGGALRHQLAESANIDFGNTDWVDLGSLSWNYSQGGGIFQCSNFTQAKMNVGESTKSNILCSKYITESKNGVVNKVVDKSISVGATTSYNGYLLVYDTTYTDATTFKNAMKGILLAYEKASE